MLRGVHGPDRLKVVNPCVTITGVVAEVHTDNPDGDRTFNLRLDAAYASMENDVNRREGGLHVEIVPADQPGCVPGQPVHHGDVKGLGTCSGADVPTPSVGQHVTVTGAYVYDGSNGWYELHPTWALRTG